MTMDEQLVDKARVLSREVVEKEFPEEAEYFDFLFDLTMEGLEKKKNGEEAEAVRGLRALYPELVYTVIVATLAVQVLADFTHRTLITEELIKEKIAALLESEDERKRVHVVIKYFLPRIQEE
jgi:hypothetical protein